MGDRRSVQPFVNARLAREISLTVLTNRHFNELGKNIEKQFIAHGENGVLQALVTAQLKINDLLASSNTKTTDILGTMQFNKLTIKSAVIKTKAIGDEIVQDLRPFIEANALRSSLLTQSTDRAIAANIIATSVEEGLTIAQTASSLRAAFTDISTNFRANRIARTEVGIAASMAQDRGAKKTGLDLLKEWIAVSDERTRANHRNVDGQRVALDGFFNVGADKMLRPHDTANGSAGNIINCRCVTDYIPEEIGEL